LVIRAVADRKLTQPDLFLGFFKMLPSSLPILRSFGQAVAAYLDRLGHGPT
jgi:hypothetical protein